LFDSIQKYGINKNIKILLLGGYAHVPGSRDYLNQKFSELNVRDNFFNLGEICSCGNFSFNGKKL
jgi:hypothetical protein